MFISNAEKDHIKIDIIGLTARVRRLEEELALLKAPKKPKTIVRTEFAPWGLKLNGTPRKRPGRAPKVMEVGKP
jgi:hypothetical protein